MPKKKIPFGLELVRAQGWSIAKDLGGKPTKRQPHLFYSAKGVDENFDKLISDHETEIKELMDQHAFEMRRMRALENFYLKELQLRNVGSYHN